MTRSPEHRESWRYRTARSAFFSMLLCAVPALAASKATGPQSAAGIWRGEMNGQPAVEIRIVDSGHALSGTATFYVMGGPDNRGKGSETALRNLTFTDGVLTFDVERSRGAAMQMSLSFVSASEGELREGPATGEGPVIVMKKQP